jgi:UDP-N-acetylmuramyl pentapeptide phosphotransferase/UDP-N-acetylglucosamine-1-phosphate transferase
MAALLPIIAAVLTASSAWVFFRLMQARKKLEPPCARSMHAAPVVSGAGAVVVAVVLALSAVTSARDTADGITVLPVIAAFLAGLSWIDDHYGGLSPAVRIAAHAAAVSVMLFVLDHDQRLVPELPLALERLVLGVAWVWFINLFNFMDGIDGLAGSEAVAVAFGCFLVSASATATHPAGSLALIVGGAAAGYLVWNWHPAKLMMGDTGSIPLGFLLGWLLIDLALRGYLAAAIILPLYFVTDATLTLVRRILRGERPWQAHRDHTYQRAALAAGSHAAVVVRVIAANIALVALALLSVQSPLAALAGAIAIVAMLMMHLERLAKGAGAQQL